MNIKQIRNYTCVLVVCTFILSNSFLVSVAFQDPHQYFDEEYTIMWDEPNSIISNVIEGENSTIYISGSYENEASDSFYFIWALDSEKNVIWEYNVPEDHECRGLILGKDGNILSVQYYENTENVFTSELIIIDPANGNQLEAVSLESFSYALLSPLFTFNPQENIIYLSARVQSGLDYSDVFCYAINLDTFTQEWVINMTGDVSSKSFQNIGLEFSESKNKLYACVTDAYPPFTCLLYIIDPSDGDKSMKEYTIGSLDLYSEAFCLDDDRIYITTRNSTNFKQVILSTLNLNLETVHVQSFLDFGSTTYISGIQSYNRGGILYLCGRTDKLPFQQDSEMNENTVFLARLVKNNDMLDYDMREMEYYGTGLEKMMPSSICWYETGVYFCGYTDLDLGENHGYLAYYQLDALMKEPVIEETTFLDMLLDQNILITLSGCAIVAFLLGALLFKGKK